MINEEKAMSIAKELAEHAAKLCYPEDQKKLIEKKTEQLTDKYFRQFVTPPCLS
jgi:hypothetical protein